MKVIAILCSDLHLSHVPPTARKAEPNWYAVMSRYLTQLRELQNKHKCHVVCAGDIFDKWWGAHGKGSTELINFAISELPKMYTVPGQHDLPYHSMKEIHKSAYWTLTQAGIIETIPHGIPKFLEVDNCHPIQGLVLHGFPWGFKIKPLAKKARVDVINLAVIHKYCWIPGHSYPGAELKGRVTKYRAALQGYDAAVFGDNHKGFLSSTTKQKNKGTTVFNCGTFLRRAIDEIAYKPQVGLLFEDGTVQSHFFDTSKDVFSSGKQIATTEISDAAMEELLEELKDIGDDPLSFASALDRYFKKERVPKAVKTILRKIMEESE